MDEQTLYEKLLTCTGPQLTVITLKLQLNPAFLPGPNESPALRASAILQLIKQRDRSGLKQLEKSIMEVIGVTPNPIVREESELSGAAPRSGCILFLAANPIDTDRLRLDREVKLIKERLDEADQGRRYRVEMEWAILATDLSKYLLKYKPSIVHFSGHGSPTGDIVLEGAHGRAEAVPAQALVDLFDTLKGTDLVVLNACYSVEQADGLAKVVPHVIGMAREIGDESALRFAAGFYRGLAFAQDYATAFRLGCNEIDLASLPDLVVPRFVSRGDERAISEPEAPAPGSLSPKNPQRSRRAHQGAEPPREEPECRLYPLWYGTNRRPIDPSEPAKGYSAERDERQIHYGLCKVAVPKMHKIGSIGSSWWERLLKWEDDRLKLVELTALVAGDYWQKIRSALADENVGERRALVYIHGFNVTFEEAALRAGQIAADLKVPGITAFYSWPSKGTMLSYSADEASIEASEGQITDFLNRFAGECGAERVDILAHSMGNRALLRSLQRIVQQVAQAGRIPFGHLVLAAPDIDAELFHDLAAAYTRVAQRTTLYVSSKDKALATSGILHDYPRAGYVPPVTVMQGIDTIEVSNADLTFLGHGYYAAARDLLHDIHDLILHGSPPKSRLGLISAKTPEGRGYWRIGG